MVIQLQDLSFRWTVAGPDTLNIPSLEVAAGEQLFIGGPSGSGKTTLLGLLAGINVPTQGRARILGQTLETLSSSRRDRFRADHIGYLFQQFNLIPYLSVIDNVLLPCHFSQRRADQARVQSGSLEQEAQRLLTHLDMGSADLLNRSVTALSVGQQQRVAAARALIGSPELIIADEPTSSLDAQRRKAFIELLFRESAAMNSTLVFVSHDTSLSPLFHRRLDLAELNQAARTEEVV